MLYSPSSGKGKESNPRTGLSKPSPIKVTMSSCMFHRGPILSSTSSNLSTTLSVAAQDSSKGWVRDEEEGNRGFEVKYHHYRRVSLILTRIITRSRSRPCSLFLPFPPGALYPSSSLLLVSMRTRCITLLVDLG